MFCHLYATYTFIFLICFVIHAQQQHCASVRGHFLDTSLSIVVASWGLQDYLDCCPLVANGVITVARGDMKLKINQNLYI